MKRTIPLIIAIVAGFVLLIANFIPYAESWGLTAQEWFNILAVGAMILGGGNLVKLHLKRIGIATAKSMERNIQRRSKFWSVRNMINLAPSMNGQRQEEFARKWQQHPVQCQ